MKFYLKYLNPAISIFVLLLCAWAAFTQDNGKVNFYGIIAGGFGTYFFAKGIFCSATLFIAGRSLLGRLFSANFPNTDYTKKDIGIVAVFAVLLAIISLGLYAKEYLIVRNSPENNTKSIESPKEIAILNPMQIKAAQYLTISAELKNSSQIQWNSIEIDAEIFIDGIYSGKLHSVDTIVKPNESRHILLKSSELLTEKISDSLNFKISVSGTIRPEYISELRVK